MKKEMIYIATRPYLYLIYYDLIFTHLLSRSTSSTLVALFALTPTINSLAFSRSNGRNNKLYYYIEKTMIKNYDIMRVKKL